MNKTEAIRNPEEASKSGEAPRGNAPARQPGAVTSQTASPGFTVR